MTTIPTTEQIKSLRAEAVYADDKLQVIICDIATDDYDFVGGVDGYNLSDLEHETARSKGLADWTAEQARAECARVIAAGQG